MARGTTGRTSSLFFSLPSVPGDPHVFTLSSLRLSAKEAWSRVQTIHFGQRDCNGVNSSHLVRFGSELLFWNFQYARKLGRLCRRHLSSLVELHRFQDLKQTHKQLLETEKVTNSPITTQRHKTQVFEEVHFKLSRLGTARSLILFNVSELVPA